MDDEDTADLPVIIEPEAGEQPARAGLSPVTRLPVRREPTIIGPVPVTGNQPARAGAPGGPPAQPLGPSLVAHIRAHPREAAAIVLLGIGGLLLPVPFWFIGAIASLLSRLWDGRDKTAAFLGPVLVCLAVTIPLAAVVGGHGNPVVVYLHLLRVDARYLIRLGCLASAGYLAWRVRRGPRLRIPPWQKHRQGPV
ncbi:MAG: hypothetical protein J2P35_06510 [Actinobacteria bacterium]|nr:hypothetical protein [Actinomycetota bacterium]MBO0788673.1 hypothetical protein [Actinomycetota bacterium]MBO0818301.1 hypothetical protein [Actinomycetota bacterium]